MASLKVYGVPLSQPFRAVVWTLLQKHQPFKVQLTVPGATTKIGSRHESFLSKTKGRTGVIPVLEEEEESTTIIAESPAILSYLCESRRWTDFYGMPGTADKAEIDSYMHWHHLNTRKIALLTKPFLRPELKLDVSAKDEEEARRVLTSIDQGWLNGEHGDYIASNHYSIADILFYEELVQATMTGVINLDKYPNIAEWCGRMESKPFHDEAHASLKTLGSLTKPNEQPMLKRLAAATKEGLKAIQAAQDSYR